jgi:multicomponent Na+:H+ antiporter subunit D
MLIEEASSGHGFGWVTPVALISSAVTGGAVLRVTGRVFMGWGPKDDEAFESHQAEEEVQETDPDQRAPGVMLAPAIGLLLAALVWGLAPGLVDRAHDGAAVFANGDAYASAVLQPGRGVPVQPEPAPSHVGSAALIGIASAFGALAVAALGLFRRRLVPSTVREWTVNILKPPLLALRGLHSGNVGDYVTWMVVGVSLLGGWLALA